MTISASKRLLLFVLCVGAMASSPDCPGTGSVRYEFELPRALPEGFVLPDSTASEGYLLRSVPNLARQQCDGFHSYEVREVGGGKPLPDRTEVLDLRIDSTRSRIAIVMGYSPDLGGEPDFWATLVSRLAVAGTGALPRVAPSKKTKIGDAKKLHAWCSTGSGR